MNRDLDDAEALLLKWADWMRQGGGNVASYPRRALGFIESWIKDNDDLVEAADGYEMRKIDSSIESLSQPYQRIIHKRHGISYIVWSFPNEDALYIAAKAAFRSRYFGA